MSVPVRPEPGHLAAPVKVVVSSQFLEKGILARGRQDLRNGREGGSPAGTAPTTGAVLQASR